MSQNVADSGAQRSEGGPDRAHILTRFDEAWQRGPAPDIAEYLDQVPAAERRDMLLDLARIDLKRRLTAGETACAEDYLVRYPELRDDAEAAASLAGHEAAVRRQLAGPAADASPLPECLGHYRVLALLGKGGFGIVYKGYDEYLRRDVAIKVPPRARVASAEDRAAYLAEARALARLDHPGIVPVWEAGNTEDGLCYVVSKFVAGGDLAARLRQGRLPVAAAAELVASVAEALHHAHKQGIVHRDVKPANILLDAGGRPVVADFGLALRDEDYGKGPHFAGTPPYMSPEQARGEGHRVDRRTDVYSLGVVLYELLTGQRPFRADLRDELLEQIKTQEPRPPRHLDDTIAPELERICLKALSKRAGDRHSTAIQLADELRRWLATEPARTAPPGRAPAPPAADPAVPSLSTSESADTDRRPPRVVPKGLRSFDAGDASFFLDLLPGPRDSDNLPESIRFWKALIGERDPDKTFRVGVLYGPSGCGKSSLVKAGLLPQLGEQVIAVYIEAAPDETEARLLKGLRRYCPGLPAGAGLVESVAALRRERGRRAGKKVLIVLDQFEQWLHARRGQENTELLQALRHCDGEWVQCLLTVRDDFWMALSRFMQGLELPVLEGQNCAAVDRFSPGHARRVLEIFGRAYERLPAGAGGLTREQGLFLDQTVAQLTRDEQVIPVRLVLFTEMVKGRPWTPATLKKVGGAEGVGMTFLEETFAAPTAPAAHRFHQEAARAVLRALLPEEGTVLKAHRRSRADLLAASGYGDRPGDFEALLRILDTELRLVTPTDPDGAGPGRNGDYQLTHDYLVPALRRWLTRKQRETRRGRAELRLAERAALWGAKAEIQQLPGWWEWLTIVLLTRKRDWTGSQQKMMRRATRLHVARSALLAVGLAAALLMGLARWGQVREQSARDLVQGLLDADANRVPALIDRMEGYRDAVAPQLRDRLRQEPPGSRGHLRASVALLRVDPAQAEALGLRPQLWQVLEDPQAEPEMRFRGACALAQFPPAQGEEARWQAAAPFIGARLLATMQQDPASYPTWLALLRPLGDLLVGPLREAFHNPERPVDAHTAAGILADYLRDRPEELAELLLDADEKQFAVLYPKFKDQAQGGLPVLTAAVDQELAPDAKDDAKEKLAKRQANAAVILLRMKQPAKVWPLLIHSRDPRVRSYLVHRLGPLGADAGALVKRLADEADVTIRRALVLSLGPEEFGEETWRPDEKKQLVEQLQEIYRADADPGLHAAAEWLLRQWQQDEWLRQTNEEWAKDKEQRAKRLDRVKQELIKQTDKTSPEWYVNSQSQTMVVIPGPLELVMGSPETEEGRSPDELQHKKRIGRTFALAAKPVTVEQYRKFGARYGLSEIERWARTADSPVISASWFQAAAYCNWLSKQEGLPESEWCYEPLQDPRAMPGLAGGSVCLLVGPLGPLAATCGLFPGRTDPKYKGGMKLARNYLQRTGYRLPTEAEIEYATRAGAATSRYFGETEDLLEKYAWYLKNAQDRTQPVGTKKPNDLGFFDLHGNVWSWCQEKPKDHAQGPGQATAEDKEDDLIIDDGEERVLRGGAWDVSAVVVRCAHRAGLVPVNRVVSVGFRPARTIR